MHSESNLFLDFIFTLERQQVLNGKEIEFVLEDLEGVEGVVEDGLFILGYENLAWAIGSKLSFEQLKGFSINNNELLELDSGSRYFFAQALLEKKGLKESERKELVFSMPKSYQEHLLRRFCL